MVMATAPEGATVTATLNGAAHENGTAATWASGSNVLVITVIESGKTATDYTVTVTKSA